MSTPKCFALSPAGPPRYHLDASHLIGLPGVSCKRCGQTWAAVGVSYPTVDLSSLLQLLPELRDPRPVSVGRLEEMRMAIQGHLEGARPLPPGTDFGSIRGTASGTLTSIVWQNPWTIFIRRTAYSTLQRRVKNLPEAGITLLNGREGELLELELPVVAILEDRVGGICRGCGRNQIPRDGSREVLLSKWPKSTEVIRVAEMPTVILATESMVSGLSALDSASTTVSECRVL